MGKRNQTAVAAWVDPDFAEEFAALARLNERSASAEARLVLKRHLESSRLAAAGAARVGAAGGGSQSLEARGPDFAESTGRRPRARGLGMAKRDDELNILARIVWVREALEDGRFDEAAAVVRDIEDELAERSAA